MFQTVLDPNEVLEPTYQPPAYEYIKQGNCLLQCVRRSDGVCLDRIISTNPKDYLNPRYRVGELFQK